jgi:hypothetical protein
MQTIAVIAGAGLAVIGLLHLLWAFSPWPLATREEFARSVVGRPDGRLPGRLFVLACLVVAGALGAAAYLVAARGGVWVGFAPGWSIDVGTWGVAAVLLGRGAWGMAASGLRLGHAPASYRRLDLAVYSPLCLLLGVLVALGLS